ncbi:P-loop containing nucleoside triphosphate hydrolase protein [Biscogniauxia mediterranea]|nr:P-loop containing nucleoside triphosphate hydrolase protein [Biscogniauxia mediterranea]
MANVQKTLADGSSASRADEKVNWKREILHQLKSPSRDGVRSQRGCWEPPAKYLNQEALREFYSGHSLNMNLPRRENYARWAITESFKGYKTGGFRVGVPDIPEDISDAVRAHGQQDVDAEDVTITKDIEGDIVQPISSAVQAMISASPNSLGPPVAPCARYLRMTRCGKYGNKGCTIWKSPLFPSLDNKDGRKGLLDHQITAIVWILSRLFGNLPSLRFIDPKTGLHGINLKSTTDYANRDRLRGPRYFGGILADSMGLGKTLVTVALLELLTSQRLNTIRDENGRLKYRPMLILVPNTTLVAQWVDEIHQSTSRWNIQDIVVSGTGIKPRMDQERTTVLSTSHFKDSWPHKLEYMWDEDDHRAAKSVIIISIDTWSSRTCKFIKDDESEENKEGEFHSTFTDLGRKFSVVVVDEAYKVKNAATLNWKSVHLLERQFTLLITATPCMNTLTDLLGLARLLWKRPRQYLEEELPEVWEAMDAGFTKLEDLKRLDRYDHWEDMQLVAGRPALLAKMLCKPRNSRSHDIQLIRDYLRHFEALAILRRSSASQLLFDWDRSKTISLQGLFPNVKNYTVDMKLDASLDHKHQEVHIGLLIRYMEAINEWNDKYSILNKKDKEAIQSISTTYRLFQIAAASLDVFQLDELLTEYDFGTKARDIGIMRKAEVDFPRLWPFCQKSKNQKPKKAVDYIRLAVRQSPVLRYILVYLKDNILNRGTHERIKKLLIVEAIPILAFYYELVLNLLGLNCRVLHADLSHEERQELIDNFNKDDLQSCQILIQMYTVGFTGTNLHKCCSQVLVASQATSFAVQQQAIHRVIRVGQMSDVTVTRLMVLNSFHSFRESRQVEKLLPELSARTHGDMGVLVRLLNLFQHEVDAAWKKPEARQLMISKNLLVENETEKGHNRVKRAKLDHGASMDATYEKLSETSDTDTSEDYGARGSFSRGFLKRKRQRHRPGHKGWFNDNPYDMTDDEAFLQIRSRDEYYSEFKRLPNRAKSLFNHEKNALRRLLSYGSPGGNLTKRVWTISDLDDIAVLERALELLVRVRLGAYNIAMLPHPQIDFSHAPAHQRRELCALLEHSGRTAQDFEAACASEAKDGAKEALKGVDVKRSLGEIDRALEEEAVRGSESRGQSQSQGRATGHVIKAETEIKQEISHDNRETDDGQEDPDAEDFGEFDWDDDLASVKSSTADSVGYSSQGNVKEEEQQEVDYQDPDDSDLIYVESGSESDSDCIVTHARSVARAPPHTGHWRAKTKEVIYIG